MEEHQSMVMTVEEVAAYLKIARSSVYKIAQEGKIPCQKVGRRWRFHRQAIDVWLSGKVETQTYEHEECDNNVER